MLIWLPKTQKKMLQLSKTNVDHLRSKLNSGNRKVADAVSANRSNSSSEAYAYAGTTGVFCILTT